jgi:hypothetical protein
MIRRLVALGVLCLAPSGCERQPAGRSPFEGSGASELRGVLAVGHLSSELLEMDEIPELLREAIPEGVEATFVWLDAKAYGGALALLFQGRDPELSLRSLLQSGVLAGTDRPDAYRLQLEDPLLDGFSDLFRSGRPLGGLAGSRAPQGSVLQRHDRGDRLVLVPTVDLREWMFDLADVVEQQPVPGLAVALDGRSLARLIREEIQPRFQLLFGLTGAASRRTDRARALEGGGFLLALALEASTQLEGAVFELRDPAAYRFESRFTARADTPLHRLFGSFDSLQLPPEPELTQEGVYLALALRPESFGQALGLLAEPLLDDRSLEFVEQAEALLEFIRTRFGGLALFSAGSGEASQAAGLALSLQPGTRREDLDSLLAWFDGWEPFEDSWRLEQGWLRLGDPRLVPLDRGGDSDLVGRFWGRSDGTWPGTFGGELRRFERGLWLK